MRTINALTSCVIGSVFCICALYLFATSFNHRKNGFIRLFPPHVADPIDYLDIKYNSYYIAGLSKSNIYLGNETAPTRLLIANQTLKDTQYLKISLPTNIWLSEASLKVTIDSPNVYMVEGMTPAYLFGEITTLKLSAFKMDTTLRFGLSRPLPHGAIILRRYYPKFKQNGLMKASGYDNKVLHSQDILKKQVDGIFCTDGMINYSPDLKYIYYVYFYRNEFLCADTNLNLIYRGHTIDTNNTAKIKTVKLKSENSTVLAEPPLEVNTASCVSDKWIFINSALMANNETEKLFKDHAVIDVYNIKDGRYRCSFYLPTPNGKKIRSMGVYNDKLFTINDHFLQSFKLNF